jgi:Ca2+-dependent lipid-binding protein
MWPSSSVWDIFSFIFLKESVSLVFCLFFFFFARGHTLHVSICVFLFCFSSLILLFRACVFACKKKQADEHTQETTELAKKNRTEEHKWERAKCAHVQKRQKPAKQISSGI